MVSVYLNALLAMLNARQNLRECAVGDGMVTIHLSQMSDPSDLEGRGQMCDASKSNEKAVSSLLISVICFR